MVLKGLYIGGNSRKWSIRENRVILYVVENLLNCVLGYGAKWYIEEPDAGWWIQIAVLIPKSLLAALSDARADLFKLRATHDSY